MIFESFKKTLNPDFFQITVPLDGILGDFKQAIAEAVKEIAKEEKKPASEIAEKLSKY